MLKAYFAKYTLNFKVPAGTSRGYLYHRPSWYIIVQNTKKPEVFGVGDCGLIPGLSIDPVEKIEGKIDWLCNNIHFPLADLRKKLEDFPALIFAVETAIWDLENGGKRKVFKSNFTNKSNPRRIPINGLIWMGDPDFMIRQIGEKIESGFNVLKLKVGAIDFQKELEILNHIRAHYKEKELEIRLDANGAFSIDEALFKLSELSKFSIHSIEQPIKPNQHNAFSRIIQLSPIPVALDEELIGKHKNTDKVQLLTELAPHYIILKPSLLGGFFHTLNWIKAADKLNIQWWITSALESNIGLNAIAQFCSTFDNPLPQGLGTGQLYTNNISSPLTIESGYIFSNPAKRWRIDFKKIAFNQLWLQPITIEGKNYLSGDFSIEKGSITGLDQNIFNFLKKWYDGNPYITFKTSGSTGKPKTIRLIKKMMINSALRTIDFFDIKQGTKALLCLSPEHIAGAMMVVRSIIGRMNLLIAEQFGHPLKEINDKIEFAAMVPTQVSNSLEDELSTKKLFRIQKLIIGGAPLDEQQLIALQNSSGKVWTTYGMTETITHIAAAPVKRNCPLVYQALPSVELSITNSGQLLLSDKVIGVEKVATNDIVELIDKKHFIWKGRRGKVINRAAYKIFPEVILAKLKEPLPLPVIVLNFDHPKYFQVPILAIEKKGITTNDYRNIAEIIANHLPKKMWPAGIQLFEKFPLKKDAIKPSSEHLAHQIRKTSKNIFNFKDLISK